MLAQELVAIGQDRSLPLAQRSFAYMSYMYCESAVVHAQAMAVLSQPGLEDGLRFESRHKEIIDRFGHFPLRNAILGRSSTADKLAFLSEPGSSFWVWAGNSAPQFLPTVLYFHQCCVAAC